MKHPHQHFKDMGKQLLRLQTGVAAATTNKQMPTSQCDPWPGFAWPGMSCKTIKDHNSLDPKPYTVKFVYLKKPSFFYT